MCGCKYWDTDKKACILDEIRKSWEGKPLVQIAEELLADADRLQAEVEEMKRQRGLK